MDQFPHPPRQNTAQFEPAHIDDRKAAADRRQIALMPVTERFRSILPLKALADQPQVKSYLVLSCNSQEQMLKASVHAYGAARLQGCVLTKLDETASMGEALGVVMQNRLPVVYTTDGQDIPKNLDVARAHQLVAKAVALLKSNPASAVS